MIKSVVTGGAGFIGSHLAEHLLMEGDEVHIIDDLSTGHRRNLPPGAKFHHASVTDAAALLDVFRGATRVFHQAALPSVPRSIENPVASYEANATGSLRVLEAARHADVEKVVLASSSSVYGDTPTLPKAEEAREVPLSPYASAKLMSEISAAVYHRTYGLRTTCLRYFNVYGPRQDPNGAYAAVVPRFASAAWKGEPVTIFGDGLQTRDFTFVEDVVNANLLASHKGRGDGLAINVGGGMRITIVDLAKKIIALTGARSSIVHAPGRKGDVRDSLASLTRAREAIGYEPKTPIESGLKETIRALQTPLPER